MEYSGLVHVASAEEVGFVLRRWLEMVQRETVELESFAGHYGEQGVFGQCLLPVRVGR
jgi:hypothetical protein